MANKFLKNGSNCAACVPYPETDADCWILTKVDKRLPGNKYLVRDEYADDPKYETYTVDSSHITPFPSTLNEEYKKGETVLALWHDEDTNEWSTMFYNAEVADSSSNDPKMVQLLYSGTDFVVDVEKNKIARLPANFTYTKVEENEDRTSTTATEEPSEDNLQKPGSDKKGRFPKEESNAPDSISPSQAVLNTANSEEATTNTDKTEPTTEEKLNVKSQEETTSNAESGEVSAKTEDSSVLPQNISSPTQASTSGEIEASEPKANETVTDQTVATDSNETNENETTPENSIQTQSADDGSKSDDQASSEKSRRSKPISKENSANNSEESIKPLTPEDRRVKFMFNKPKVVERPQFKCLTNEDFTELAGPKQELVRMDTKEGTPLLDFLQDSELFNQENLLHVTGSGVISVANVERGNEKSGLAEGRVPCGRLKRIINEWIKNPMDSI